jgi:putative SOS response-associated peptidase YedK
MSKFDLETSNLYRPCLTRRCVVLCDGFYEWQRDGPVKQPYIIYARYGDFLCLKVLSNGN